MKSIKDKIKIFFKSRYTILTVFIIVIYFIYLYISNIIPFGNKTILKSDSYQQYVNFFCYLREALLNGKSLLISWNLGLGNGFFTTFAYYLASPLNIFVIFFNSENMHIYVEFMILLKMILIGNFMMIFLSKSYGYKKSDSIIFGLMYAFSSYVMCYAFHIMWLDAVYMLPIVLLLVDKYIKTKKIYPYIIALGYTIIVNYYTGFMVAFFSGIYYLAKYYISIEGKIVTIENGKRLVFNLIKFLFGIGVAFGISMIVFIPSFIQSSGNMSTRIQLLDIDVDKLRLFSNVIFNNYVYMFTQKSCLVFSSTLVLLLIPTYYLNKNIKLKEKLVFSIIIIFLLMPIISPFINKLWHGLATPNCFNYRYSFVLIFTLILMTFRAYQNKEKLKKSHMYITMLVFFVLTLVEVIIKKLGYLTSDGYEVSYQSIILSCAIYLAMWIITFIIINQKKKREIFNILLVIIIIIDLLIGASHSIINNDKFFSLEDVTQHDNAMKELLQYVENKETDRIVFIPDNYGSNMSLKYGYSNIGFFTSPRNRKTIENMYKLGYNIQRAEQLWLTSFSGTYFNYTLAGVKYYITQQPLEENEIYGFELIKKVEDYYLYKNKNSIPFGFYINENIMEAENPFEMQNSILSTMTKSNGSQKYMLPLENGQDLLECNKVVIKDNNEEIRWKYTVYAKKDINLYLYSDGELQLYKDGEEQFKEYANLWSIEAGIKGIKHLNENETYEFEISVEKEEYEKENPIYIYATDNKKIEQDIKIVQQDTNNFKIEKIQLNNLYGKATVTKEGYLCLPIAYDDGWRATVNGEKVNVESIYNVFTGIKLKEGTYDIKLYFIPRGFKMGLAISGISVILLFIIIILEKNKGKREEKDDKKIISEV